MKEVKNFSIKIKTLEETLRAAKSYFSDMRHEQELKWFETWIQAQIGLAAEGLDGCPKCHNDPDKTPGAIPCERCGAVGQQPWGG